MKQNRLHWFKFFSVIIVALICNSCGSLFPKPSAAPKLCVLNPVETFEKDLDQTPKVTWHLAIDLPSGGASYDTSRIARVSKSSEISYFSQIEWTDRLPLLLQNLLVKSFENTNKIKGVARAAAGINPDRLLMLDIRHFQATLTTQTPYIEATLTAKIVNMTTRRIENTQIFKTRTPLASLDHEHIIEGFQTATQQLLSQIVLWVLSSSTTDVTDVS